MIDVEPFALERDRRVQIVEQPGRALFSEARGAVAKVGRQQRKDPRPVRLDRPLPIRNHRVREPWQLALPPPPERRGAPGRGPGQRPRGPPREGLGGSGQAPAVLALEDVQLLAYLVRRCSPDELEL